MLLTNTDQFIVDFLVLSHAGCRIIIMIIGYSNLATNFESWLLSRIWCLAVDVGFLNIDLKVKLSFIHNQRNIIAKAFFKCFMHWNIKSWRCIKARSFINQTVLYFQPSSSSTGVVWYQKGSSSYDGHHLINCRNWEMLQIKTDHQNQDTPNSHHKENNVNGVWTCKDEICDSNKLNFNN